MQTTIIRHILRSLPLGVLLLSLTACYNDEYDAEVAEYTNGMVGVELTIQTRSISDISSTSETYVEGTEWENYIDIAGGDYRIYFFTYDPTTETGSGKGTNSTLIAEFKPTDILSTDEGTYTSYYLSGEIDKDLVASLTNFKVLVIANWGTYPTVTAGTTIDDICNAGMFNAFVDSDGSALIPSSSLHIPFFGLREYSNVTWTPDRRTTLNGAITLLRAVAKVEVILENTNVSFTELTINNYNAQGYCAPTGVYLRGDYDHDYTWSSDFVDGLHLVNGANDAGQDGSHTISMYRSTNSDGYETWVAYLPEYDNTSASAVYSYISAKFDYENDHDLAEEIYFSNYANGITTSDADYDIYRNYLYRFHVTLANFVFQVHVDKWENTYENDFVVEGDVTYTDNPDPDDDDDPYGTDPY